MGKVTGIGGFFFKSRDAAALRAWYQQALGIPISPYGSYEFEWRDLNEPEKTGRTVWSPFEEKSDYFGPSAKPFMFNFRVEDLPGLLAQLKAAGVTQVGAMEEYDYGRFAWILDPEGNKIELWEPPPPAA